MCSTMLKSGAQGEASIQLDPGIQDCTHRVNPCTNHMQNLAYRLTKPFIQPSKARKLGATGIIFNINTFCFQTLLQWYANHGSRATNCSTVYHPCLFTENGIKLSFFLHVWYCIKYIHKVIYKYHYGVNLLYINIMDLLKSKLTPNLRWPPNN